MEGVAEPIRIWRFEYAPAEYRARSEHGGDEDWVAFVPEYIRDAYLGWMDEGTPFGCCHVSEHEVVGGVVRISVEVKLREEKARRPLCHCSWDYVTGGHPNYYCGRCGEYMRR